MYSPQNMPRGSSVISNWITVSSCLHLCTMLYDVSRVCISHDFWLCKQPWVTFVTMLSSPDYSYQEFQDVKVEKKATTNEERVGGSPSITISIPRKKTSTSLRGVTFPFFLPSRLVYHRLSWPYQISESSLYSFDSRSMHAIGHTDSNSLTKALGGSVV